MKWYASLTIVACLTQIAGAAYAGHAALWEVITEAACLITWAGVAWSRDRQARSWQDTSRVWQEIADQRHDIPGPRP